MDDWIRLFRVESREELEMLQSKNLGILEAVKEVKEMNLSRMIKAWYEERQKDSGTGGLLRILPGMRDGLKAISSAAARASLICLKN